MTTRSKNGIVKPRLQPTLLLTHVVPKTVKTTLKDPKWKDAMDEKMVALLKTIHGNWFLNLLIGNQLVASGFLESSIIQMGPSVSTRHVLYQKASINSLVLISKKHFPQL